jgi:hypothetical protein
MIKRVVMQKKEKKRLEHTAAASAVKLKKDVSNNPTSSSRKCPPLIKLNASDVNLDAGIPDQELRPCETNSQSFSGLLMPPEKRQAMPTMARGIVAGFDSGSGPGPGPGPWLASLVVVCVMVDGVGVGCVG